MTNLNEIERDAVLKLANNGDVDRSLAEQLIKVSLYWYSHPSGVPVQAPNHFKHIYCAAKRREALNLLFEDGVKVEVKPSDWKIDFGANTFAISKAVLRCQQTLIEFLAVEQDSPLKVEEIKEKLYFHVRESVENFEGREFLYPMNCENHMIFGASSLCVDDFVNFILNKCQAYKKLNQQRSPICPICMKRFKNRLALNYHHQTTHYKRGK